MDQDNNNEDSEQSSHHALRQRCMSALAVASTQPSVMLESTPVLFDVLSSAHRGDVSGQRSRSNGTQWLVPHSCLTNEVLFHTSLILSLVWCRRLFYLWRTFRDHIFHDHVVLVLRLGHEVFLSIIIVSGEKRTHLNVILT